MFYKNYQTRNKYRAVKTEYKGGVFDSKKEAQFAMWLDTQVKKKKIKDYKKQVKIDLFGQNGTRICYYKADFEVLHNDDVREIIDVKSKITATPYFRLKWKLLEDKYKLEIKKGLIKLTQQF